MAPWFAQKIYDGGNAVEVRALQLHNLVAAARTGLRRNARNDRRRQEGEPVL